MPFDVGSYKSGNAFPPRSIDYKLEVLEFKLDQVLWLLSSTWPTCPIAGTQQAGKEQMSEVLRYMNPDAAECVPNNVPGPVANDKATAEGNYAPSSEEFLGVKTSRHRG